MPKRFCCHQNVSVNGLNLKILTHIVEKNTKENTIAFLSISKFMLKKLQASLQTDFDENLLVLLADNRCTIHSVRPLQCRGGFSEKKNIARISLKIEPTPK